jgi:ATP-dependent Clp protease ATP-binding subunit ClpA
VTKVRQLVHNLLGGTAVSRVGFHRVFKRFTERARHVVVLAQDEARALKHNYIGTEHILLGLLREEEGVAARVLESLGIRVEEVRALVAQIVGTGDEVTPGQIPFTPRAKKALELALREALTLSHNYIGTEHILLGLVRDNEGAAARILLEFDANPKTIRDRVVETLVSAPRPEPGRRQFRRPVEMVGAHALCWEYRVEQRDAVNTDWLNELGAEGWELVSVRPGTDSLELIFKRRRQFPGSLRAAG